MSNERKQAMPPHCGNCLFHEWEADSSKCVHPCKVRWEGDELNDEVAALCCEGNKSAICVVEALLEDALEAQEWQPYDSVCDNWRGGEGEGHLERGAEKRTVRGEAKDKFFAYIESMIPDEYHGHLMKRRRG